MNIRLTFRQKLWFPLAASLLCLVAIATMLVLNARHMRYEERKLALANIDQAALKQVERFAADAQEGRITEEEAKQRAMRAMKAIRFGDDGYIAINGMDAHAIQNPVFPDYDGKDMSGFKDANGFYVYRELANIGNSAAGEGFLTYLWLRPGEHAASTKLSRVVAFKRWGWVLVAGMYIDDIDKDFYASLTTVALMLLVAATILTLIVLAINRSLQRALGGSPEYAIEVATQIAGKDLSAAIDTARDDTSSLLFAMKTMQANLAEMISAIHDSAAAIATSSAEIAAGNLDLSSRTEMQASTLEETAASMEEFTQAVTHNAENARIASELAVSASDVARHGGGVVEEVTSTMAAIHTSAAKIEDITGVIDGIAFQTNILALNAAVEAARAGEQGRGFAVVASEVRNLAQRSASAAKEIKTLIDDSVQRIGAGAALAEKAGETMEKVVGSVTRVTAIVADISAASHEQRTGIGHVNTAITEIDTATQQNAALVEQAAAAAGSLRDQAAGLTELVNSFRLTPAAAAPSHAAPQRLRLR
ncbi:methyl-accepting chemotaxis protein [Pseudoduganella sp. FT25W]|uniref:Methyl-accepting chemotaxis protein n=1 Tax=Duganella alba TaxID=2666081 RepID=A0A6L5QKR4_9BURK|nr:methyl-accepting chemotaxis protein [Duganella alba]MRX10309.1 methyl-accepting chemotaxis protein [Duganella alba]MRX18596.1 methyl-accepting chemotaxis protein [Duganella alba]